MTTATAARTVSEVQVAEVRDEDGKLRDRRIMVILSCGHAHHVGIPLDAPLPRVGDDSDWQCLPCRMAGVGR